LGGVTGQHRCITDSRGGEGDVRPLQKEELSGMQKEIRKTNRKKREIGGALRSFFLRQGTPKAVTGLEYGKEKKSRSEG